ncbi:hypothetical protein J0A71_05g11590 [Encephalitozoon cuniculi]|nr:hypothetical protein J0A71_05g11590 [Encephalitozoon cuniculi]
MEESELHKGFRKTGSGMFVPRDQSQNWCRHFGVRKDKTLYLREEEVLYLRDKEAKEGYPTKTKAYFFVKNSGYNLLPGEGGRFLLYRKHKDFNREKDKAICLMKYVSRDECIQDVCKDAGDEALCVLSDDVFTFLKIRRVERLDSSTPEGLKKRNAPSP